MKNNHKIISKLIKKKKKIQILPRLNIDHTHSHIFIGIQILPCGSVHTTKEGYNHLHAWVIHPKRKVELIHPIAGI